ncbi:MAG: DNA-binding transcriptional regulator [Verrucomicrobiota bacterium JB022]|nr:DNA-binding transcriptional regulator [Verrucomicrobiota bacterium JB022]
MLTDSTKNVALILQTRMEENIGILNGIAAYERENADWNFFLDDQSMSVSNHAWLFRREWDGVICRHRSSSLLEECVRRGIPCVDLDDSPILLPGVPKLRPDNLAVGHVAAEHFIERGFKRFAFCGFGNETWSCERRRGFMEAVQAVGCECSVLETIYTQQLTPDWDIAEQERIGAWVKELEHPLALMACNDLRALQVIAAVHQVGLSIPDEVAVLGSNNESVRANLSHPPLSSVPINAADWGYRAAQALHGLFDGKPVAAETFIDPGAVVVRRSTDILAVEDPAIVEALRIIQSEATGPLRVEDLARRVNLSRSLLERRFRKFLRRSPQEEIRNVKINKAKQLLLDTDMTLAEIAEAIGFEHPEYLSVMFKRLTSESPRDFRQRYRPKVT